MNGKRLTMIEHFEAARRVSVPIVVVRTADQQATVEALSKAADKAPLLSWDAADGLTGLNDTGLSAVRGAKAEHAAFVDAMTAALKMPQSTVLFVHNAHMMLTSTEPSSVADKVQAVANLREAFKKNFRMVVLMGPHMRVPAELEQDVVMFDHALPVAGELETIVKELYEGTPYKKRLSDAVHVRKCVEAISGLSAFAAEQTTAMSFTEAAKGVDLDLLWERKRVAIEAAPGLKVYRGGERFSDIVGLEGVKARLASRLRGKRPVGVVVWLDEIDKVFANVEHDTSGVRMDQFRTLLAEMEDNEWEGVVLAGLPGGGKSLLGKAFGNEAGVPTISLDLAAMEGSLVGMSEQQLRHGIDVIKAVGGGNAYFVATSNNATIMRPELQRRFTGGFYFFDLMAAEEKRAAWAYFMKKYDLPQQPLPDDTMWLAAEIRNCAREAANTGCTLREAAQFVLPVAQSRAPEFEAMREYAHGRYMDASKAGPYVHDPKAMERAVSQVKAPRAMNIGMQQLVDAVQATALANMPLKEN